jgi:hypothetical protein
MSVESRQIEVAFGPRHGAVQFRPWDEDQGPRNLCNAVSDRQALGLARQLAPAHAGSRGDADHRLSTEPPSPLRGRGEVLDISSGQIWRQPLALRLDYHRLDPQSG